MEQNRIIQTIEPAHSGEIGLKIVFYSLLFTKCDIVLYLFVQLMSTVITKKQRFLPRMIVWFI